MSKKILTVKHFNGGISPSEKEGIRGGFYLSQNLDVISEPSNLTLNKKTTKDSGTTGVVDLIKWFVSGSPHDTNLYSIGDTGKFYKRISTGTWSVLQTTANCYGQGMELYSDYIYYTQNTQVGRYGPLSGAPAFTDAWKTSLTDTSATGKRFAPIKTFAAGMAVGHGNIVSWWDGTVWTLARLTLPTGFNIRAFDVIDEYLVISAWKGSTITNSEEGIAFFWDGTATKYNFPIPIPDGGMQAVINSRNRLLSMVNTDGTIYLNYQPFQKVHKIPFLSNANYLEIYPGAVTNWRGSTFIGVAANTDTTSIVQGVYQWGAKSDKYNEILNLAYTPSHGKTQLTTLHIGALKGIGNVLYISWQDDATYGVDVVSSTASPFATGTYQSLIFDDNRPLQEKLAVTIKAKHKALAAGESIQLGYKTNRAAAYVTDTANSTVGSTVTRLPIPTSAARFYDFQFEVILAATGTTSPTVTSIGLEYDDLANEFLV